MYVYKVVRFKSGHFFDFCNKNGKFIKFYKALQVLNNVVKIGNA